MDDAAYEQFLEHSKTTHPMGRVGTVQEVGKPNQAGADLGGCEVERRRPSRKPPRFFQSQTLNHLKEKNITC